MISDEVLMLEFQDGSRAALEELYSRYRGPLYGFFRRRLDSPQRAEELAQETFLVVIRGASHFEPRALVRTYLYGIAMKLLFNERRRQTREGPSSENLSEPAAAGTQETGLWVRQAVARLEVSEREILMLREYEQLSYAEIADLLQLPVNTVRSRLFRARMALKEQLDPKHDFRRRATVDPAARAAEGEA
jgi:RNA polymerase sigma-70 factor, ECF subfamily